MTKPGEEVDPYVSPASQEIESQAFAESWSKLKSLRAWTTVLLLYPAWDLSTPILFYLAAGDPPTAESMAYAIWSIGLLASAALVWLARGRMLLLASIPVVLSIFHYGFSMPPIALTAAALLILVLFSKLPARSAGT